MVHSRYMSYLFRCFVSSASQNVQIHAQWLQFHITSCSHLSCFAICPYYNRTIALSCVFNLLFPSQSWPMFQSHMYVKFFFTTLLFIWLFSVLPLVLRPKCGPGSSVCIATGYGSFPGVKRPGHGADQPPPPSVENE
jgi:hypothetical protein